MRRLAPLACGLLAACLSTEARADRPGGHVRIATFNLQDLNADSITSDPQRVAQLAQVIRALDADIIFLNEVAEGAAEPFVSRCVNAPETANYRLFHAPSNTGVHAGLDLDNNDQIDPTPGSRIYAGDCWGYGEFPGQYAMALLVRDGFQIMDNDVRTFRQFLWKDMPGAILPPLIEQEGGAAVERAWYSQEELARFPLSSKSHWDVPVRTPGGDIIHVLCSHPTPPVFDGPEDRNGRRNHDEIRFWGEYLSGADWIIDDAHNPGALAPDAQFVIVGDLNADTNEGDSRGDPVGRWLIANPRVNAAVTPTSTIETQSRRGPLEPDDTAMFGLRVDYVLPSQGLDVARSGVVRGMADLPDHQREAAQAEWAPFPSDHFPVWIDVTPKAGDGADDESE